MIICLIIIIIVLLLILCIWWVYKNNNNKNSLKSLNGQLSYMVPPKVELTYMTLPKVEPTYVGNIDDSIEEINKAILNNTLEFNNTLYSKKNAPISTHHNQYHFYYQENNNGIDYDESNAIQGLKRNDPLRPTIGIIDRGSMMDSFLREELTDAESKEWWGNGDW